MYSCLDDGQQWCRSLESFGWLRLPEPVDACQLLVALSRCREKYITFLPWGSVITKVALLHIYTLFAGRCATLFLIALLLDQSKCTSLNAGQPTSLYSMLVITLPLARHTLRVAV